MQLVEDIRAALAQEQSPFRAQLLKEDVTRLERLGALKAKAQGQGGTREDFLAQAMRGTEWTPGNFRTRELQCDIERFLTAFWLAADAAAEAALGPLWTELTAQRINRLVGCLARVPPPLD